jgi:hypothetical protein
VNAPRSWPNSSLSITPAGSAAQFSLDQDLRLAPAEVVDGPDDQLLAGAGLSRDENGGIGAGDLAHAGLDGQHRPRLSDDVPEGGLRPDLLLQVEVFLLQP